MSKKQKIIQEAWIVVQVVIASAIWELNMLGVQGRIDWHIGWWFSQMFVTCFVLFSIFKIDKPGEDV